MVFPPSNGQLKRGKRSGTSEILKFRAIGAVIIYRKLVWNHRIDNSKLNLNADIFQRTRLAVDVWKMFDKRHRPP